MEKLHRFLKVTAGERRVVRSPLSPISYCCLLIIVCLMCIFKQKSHITQDVANFQSRRVNPVYSKSKSYCQCKIRIFPIISNIPHTGYLGLLFVFNGNTCFFTFTFVCASLYVCLCLSACLSLCVSVYICTSS